MGNSITRVLVEEHSESGGKVNGKKVEGEPIGANFGKEGEVADEDERANTPTREQEQVGSHDAVNSPAGSNDGNGGVGGGEDVDEVGKKAAEQVKEQETPRAAHIFNPPAVNPQRQHVTEQVQDAAVKKHVGQRRNSTTVCLLHGQAGDGAELVDKGLKFGNIAHDDHILEPHDEGVERDDGKGHKGPTGEAVGFDVVEGEHKLSRRSPASSACRLVMRFGEAYCRSSSIEG